MGQALSQIRFSNSLRMRTDLHILRKIWHIMTGAVGLYVYYSSGKSAHTVATTLLVFAIVAFVVEFVRVKNEKVNVLLMSIMRPLMRESEKNSISGMPFYALGVSLSLFFFPTKVAVLSVFFLVLADPIASFFGILYGRDKILPNKSLQGTIAAYTVCYVTTLVYGLVHTGSSMNLLTFSLVAGLVGAVSELCSQFVDDNLCIPVLSGLGLTILNYFIQVF